MLLVRFERHYGLSQPYMEYFGAENPALPVAAGYQIPQFYGVKCEIWLTTCAIPAGVPHYADTFRCQVKLLGEGNFSTNSGLDSLATSRQLSLKPLPEPAHTFVLLIDFASNVL